MNKKTVLILLAASLLVAGQAFGQAANGLTPEEQRVLLQLLMRQQAAAQPAAAAQAAPGGPAQLLQQMMQAGAAPAPAPAEAAQRPVAGATTEAELAAIFAKLPKLPTGVVFERFRDGFSVNGVRYIDPEGTISAYGFDALSGDFTYLAQTSAGLYVLKSGRANSGVDPIAIGTAERRGDLWSITTVTGKKFTGRRLIPASRGFVLARDNTGFRYIPGKGTTSFAAPEEFFIAAHQNGDIANTGFILLERNPATDDSAKYGSLGQLFSTVKSLGSTLGIGRKDDYALLDIDSHKLVPINISLDDKQVQVMSACRQRNAFFAECARMDSYDSLFQANGTKNLSHYFWRISWFNTPANRPVLVSQEGGLSRVVVADLKSGKKAVLFERSLGIAGFEARQRADGRIDVNAQMGFSSESKTDALSLLDAAPDVATEPAKGEQQAAAAER